MNSTADAEGGFLGEKIKQAENDWENRCVGKFNTKVNLP